MLDMSHNPFRVRNRSVFQVFRKELFPANGTWIPTVDLPSTYTVLELLSLSPRWGERACAVADYWLETVRGGCRVAMDKEERVPGPCGGGGRLSRQQLPGFHEDPDRARPGRGRVCCLSRGARSFPDDVGSSVAPRCPNRGQ